MARRPNASFAVVGTACLGCLWPQQGALAQQPLQTAAVVPTRADLFGHIERMTGAELVRLLAERQYQGWDIRLVIQDDRWIIRSLRRIGSLRYEPGIPLVLAHIDGEYTDWDDPPPNVPRRVMPLNFPPVAGGALHPAQGRIVLPILSQFGARAVPQGVAAWLRDGNETRRFLLANWLAYPDWRDEAQRHLKTLLGREPDGESARDLRTLLREVETHSRTITRIRQPCEPVKGGLSGSWTGGVFRLRPVANDFAYTGLSESAAGSLRAFDSRTEFRSRAMMFGTVPVRSGDGPTLLLRPGR